MQLIKEIFNKPFLFKFLIFDTASKPYIYHMQSFGLAISRFAPLCGRACVRICVPVGAPVAWCECDLPSRSG